MKNDLLPFSLEHLGEMDILSNGVESSGDREFVSKRNGLTSSGLTEQQKDTN